MSPIAIQESVPSLRRVMAEFCTRVLGVADVAPVETTVTPEAPETVTCPAPNWTRSTQAPIGNGTDELSGIVTAIADALARVISEVSSAITSVYEVPVWVLIAWVIWGAVRVLLVRVCEPVKVVTTEVSTAIVPDVEIVPPDNPVPAVMLVTVPAAA